MAAPVWKTQVRLSVYLIEENRAYGRQLLQRLFDRLHGNAGALRENESLYNLRIGIPSAVIIYIGNQLHPKPKLKIRHRIHAFAGANALFD